MSRWRAGYKHTQVQWEDLRAWVEQLWGTHGALAKVTIQLMPLKTHVASAVVLDVTKPSLTGASGWQRSRWQTFDTTVVGGAEAAALQLISRVLIELDDEAARAEQRTFL